MQKSSWTCDICHEKFTVQADGKWTRKALHPALYLKAHCHYAKHNKRFLTNKGITKYLITLIIIALICIVSFPIFFITLPFWAIHEWLS